MDGNSVSTTSWPELAIGLYDKLTGRGAEIAYRFEEFDVDVPSTAGSDSPSARWRVNGTLRVSTRDRSTS